MNRIIIVSVLVLLIGINATAHPWKPDHKIIIDTDCGIDDYRAICMLLNAPDIRVVGIITSNGVLDAEKGYVKLRNLLSDWHHEGILCGITNYAEAEGENCGVALNFSWGEESGLIEKKYTAKQLTEYVLNNTKGNVDYVCLGSLNSVVGLYNESSVFRKRVGSIIWSSDAAMNDENYNYCLDKDAFRYITEETDLNLKIITVAENSLKYDTPIIMKIQEIGNTCANKVYSSFTSIQSPFATVFYDERIPIYFRNEQLFQSDTLSHFIQYKLVTTELSEIENYILKLIEGYSGDENQVLEYFPMDSSFYQSDIQKIMYKAIENYGAEEWIAGVLSNELHRHLGVYAIIGTKMGIRAREYFGAGIDEIKIISFAGVTPPFSCMNDGLQVSTGATLGHGLIKLASDTFKLPVAEFTYMGRTIKISLKEKYRQRIEREISEYRLVYGLSSDMYWEMVRNAALNYWVNWSRHEIFTIKR